MLMAEKSAFHLDVSVHLITLCFHLAFWTHDEGSTDI